MFYSEGENRHKRWYDLLIIGRGKLLILGSLLGVLFIAAVVVLVTYSYRASEYDLEHVVAGNSVSTLYDCELRPIAVLSNENAQFARWEELPRNLVNAFVAREDDSFFEHSGVVYSSVVRSLLRNMESMSYEQGASTITMQLARNVYELSGKTLDRKLLEMMLAYRIEKRYDKKQILCQYLNRIYFGQNCYGIAEASAKYFGKHVSELNLVECATLAGLVRGPSIFNPVSDMGKAMVVKQETLARMLEMEFISQEEYDNAVAADIPLASDSALPPPVLSYASMWVQQELEELQDELGDNIGGAGIVSNLDLELQQRVEQSMERALVAVEKSGCIPGEWMPLLDENPTEAQRLQKFYDSIVRPKEMKIRGEGNDMDGVLQCCVLVVDARRNNKGRILAMVSGRSAVDGRDRWREMTMPGNAMAPLLNTCASRHGSHIVAGKPQVTGMSLGYDVVSAMYKELGLKLTLPERRDELSLYKGEFPVRRLDLVRVLFDIQNDGVDHRFWLVDRVWSRANKLLFSHDYTREKDYISRENTVPVAGIAPFQVSDGQPVVLNETLPQQHGNLCMVFNNKGVAVFVWMGFDNPADMPQGSRMAGLIKKVSYCLAMELHTAARAGVRERAAKDKKP